MPYNDVMKTNPTLRKVNCNIPAELWEQVESWLNEQPEPRPSTRQVVAAAFRVLLAASYSVQSAALNPGKHQTLQKGLQMIMAEALALEDQHRARVGLRDVTDLIDDVFLFDLSVSDEVREGLSDTERAFVASAKADVAARNTEWKRLASTAARHAEDATSAPPRHLPEPRSKQEGRASDVGR